MANWKALSIVQCYNTGRPHWLAVLWLLSALLLSACGGSGGDGDGESPNDPNNPTELKDPQLTLQSDAAVTLNIGSTHTNTASSTNGSTGSISYTSSDTDIADVDGNGLVTAKTVGDTTITATIEATATHKASSVSYDVTVIALQEAGLEFANSDRVTLGVGQTHTNAASSTNGSTGSISYESSNTEVADVDGNGLVTAKAVGVTTITATIAATATHKASSVSYDMEVIELKDSGLQFTSSDPVTLGVGQTHINTASSTNGSTGSINYTSQDESVAEVDANSGEVTAKAIGDTTITATIAATATHKEGSATYSISVELNDPALQLANSGVVTLRINDTHPTQIINKEGDGDISYESDNPSVADIDPEGLVTAKAVGNATITVKVIETASYAADRAEYSVDVIGSGGTLSLWLEEDGAQWQMPKGFAGADFYGTTAADCPYEASGKCANATIKSSLLDGALFDDDGVEESKLKLGQSTAYYQLTHDGRIAQGLFSAEKWEPRKNHQAVYYNDRFWIVVGNAKTSNGLSPVKDIWSSPDGKNWREDDVFPLQQGRIDHQVVVYDFNDGNGEQLVLIAGNKKNDIWTFDEDRSTDKWQEITLDGDGRFDARGFHQAVVFDGHLWVIGGLKFDNTRLSDAWKFEPTGADSGRWNKQTIEGDFPARYQHQAVVFDGKLWVMGGLDATNNRLNDVWVLNAEETSWEDKTTATGADQIDALKRANFELAVFNNRLWLIGGKTDAEGYASLNDVWSLGKGADATWQQELEQAPFSVRNGHQVVVARGRMWLFGGGKGDNNHDRDDAKNDVWSTADGKLWRLESAEPEIGTRSSHQVVAFAPTDTDGNVGERGLWLVGGQSGPTNKIWSSLDGVNWALATDAALFDARYDHSLAEFDGRLWLVGGRDASNNTIDDAWSSADGVVWQNEADRLPNNFPALAESQLVAFENRLWLFGGANNNGSSSNEVWSLGQGDEQWQPQESSNFPHRRGHQIVVFNGDTLLMSGGSQVGVRNHVWVSNNGVDWDDERSAESSSLYTGRDRHQMVIVDDGIDRSLVVMGGTSNGVASGALSDIWTSTDGGFTWEQKVSEAPFGKVLNHQVVTFNDGTGDKLWLIGGDILGNQIWRSEDGINWQKLQKSDFQFAEPDSSPTP